MKRQLPQYIIEGTLFTVDVANQLLKETAHPDNTILFEEISFKGSHYAFDYDLTTKNLPVPFRANPEYIVPVQLPQRIELDKEGMSLKYGIPLSELAGRNDFEIIVDQQLLALRKAGVLPKIDIAGHEFIVDIRLSELRPKNDLSGFIKFSDLDYSVERESYRAFYQPSARRVVVIDPCSVISTPKDTVMIEIPSEWKLDPYGFAREKGLDMQNTLMKYPIGKHLSANVVPLSMTNIPAIILGNKKRMREQATSNTPASTSYSRKKNKNRKI